MQKYEMIGEVEGTFYRAEEVETEIAKLKDRIEKQKEINKELVDENEELKRQLEEMTKNRDAWKQRAIDTYYDF